MVGHVAGEPVRNTAVSQPSDTPRFGPMPLSRDITGLITCVLGFSWYINLYVNNQNQNRGNVALGEPLRRPGRRGGPLRALDLSPESYKDPRPQP